MLKFTRTHTHTRACAHTHTHTRARVHTHTRTHACMHAHSLSLSLSLSPLPLPSRPSSPKNPEPYLSHLIEVFILHICIELLCPDLGMVSEFRKKYRTCVRTLQTYTDGDDDRAIQDPVVTSFVRIPTPAIHHNLRDAAHE